MNKANESIHIAVVTPEKILFEGTAISVQVPARDGYMGFLPRHAPLVSPLGIGILTCIQSQTSITCFAIAYGYFEIHENKLVLLADIAEKDKDIDIERAQKARDRAIERLLESEPGKWNVERAQIALAKALNRIRVAAHNKK